MQAFSEHLRFVQPLPTLNAFPSVVQQATAQRSIVQASASKLIHQNHEELTVHQHSLAGRGSNFCSDLNFPARSVRARCSRERTVPTAHSRTLAASS